MTKFRLPLALITATAVAALTATVALGGGARIVPFKATFKGTATTKVTGSRVDITARATGTGPLIGVSRLTGVGVGTKSGDAACVPFTGPGTIVTAKRTTIKFTVAPSSTGCGSSDNNTVTVTGTAKVTGGTGTYRLARGTWTFSGYYDRGTGAFTVTFSGSMRV